VVQQLQLLWFVDGAAQALFVDVAAFMLRVGARCPRCAAVAMCNSCLGLCASPRGGYGIYQGGYNGGPPEGQDPRLTMWWCAVPAPEIAAYRCLASFALQCACNT
jgi:hypothetical protein